MSIEYRVKRVERFIVTRHETAESTAGDSPGKTRQIGGEHDNADVAYEVAYALARKEQEDLGLPPGDMGVIFPQHPKEAARMSPPLPDVPPVDAEWLKKQASL